MLILLLTWVCSSAGQTLRINEFSNGSAGAQEWVELLVVPTTPVANSPKTCFLNSINVAGWILDDNNGVFSPTNHYSGSGIAASHIRFGNTAPWTRLPMGALIVIYNGNTGEKDPAITLADDPFDINNDCVYVLPSSHPSLEYCTTGAPGVTSCTVVSDYSSCTSYGSHVGGSGFQSWNAVGLANNGDGMQLRDASFTQVHGVVYGASTSATGCTSTPNLVGNAVTPYISGAGGGLYFAYNGTDVAGYFTAANWITGAAAGATPGAANNANNAAMIATEIRKGCICDVTLPLGPGGWTDGRRNILPFTAQAAGGSLVFQSSAALRIVCDVFAPDGRLLQQYTFGFSGRYQLPILQHRPCLVRIYAKGNNGLMEQRVVKYF